DEGCDRRLVERDGNPAAIRSDAADHLRRIASAVDRIPRIDPLGTKCQEKIGTDLEPGALERRQEYLARRTGIRGALEDDCLAGPKSPLDRFGGRHNEAHIRVLELREWRRDTDRNRIGLAQSIGLRGGTEPARDLLE